MTAEALNDKWQEFSFLSRGVEFGTNSLKVSPIDNYRFSGEPRKIYFRTFSYVPMVPRSD